MARAGQTEPDSVSIWLKLSGEDAARMTKVLARPEFAGWTRAEWCLEMIQTALGYYTRPRPPTAPGRAPAAEPEAAEPEAAEPEAAEPEAAAEPAPAQSVAPEPESAAPELVPDEPEARVDDRRLPPTSRNWSPTSWRDRPRPSARTLPMPAITRAVRAPPVAPSSGIDQAPGPPVWASTLRFRLNGW